MSVSCQKYILSFLAVVLLFASCNKDKPKENPPVKLSEHAVLVLNEGNFNWGNASIDLINLSTATIQEDIFMKVNLRPLGDVLQSACTIGDEIWLVLNNSMKIERVNAQDFKSTGSIQGLQSPRYILPLAQKIYVSDLYANQIHIIDRQSGKKGGSIKCPGWTEEMLLIDDQAWVCNVRKGMVYIVNTKNDNIVDSVKVGDAPRSIVKDNKGYIWVLCEGNIPPQETAGSLWKIDSKDKSILFSVNFQPGRHPSTLCVNAQADHLYFLNNGVYRMSADDSSLPATALIEQGSRLLYGLSVNPADNSIWLSDAKDYVQKGEVLRYSASAELTNSWKSGIIPRSFYFY